MKTLNPQVAAKYQLVGLRPNKYSFKGFGEIDLCSLTLARADELVKRGFQFLKPRETGTAGEPAQPVNLGARPLKIAKQVPSEPAENPVALRGNKQFINKLLTLNFSDLLHQDKLIFFNDEKYFLEKKQALLEISGADRDMKSLHAKVKSLAKDPKKKDELAKLMNQIAGLEDFKVKKWQVIDTWNDPTGTDPEQIKKEAAKEAIERDKQIKAHGNYIYRAELALPNMPKSKAADKKRYDEKLAEVERRKAELVKLGSPYDRKSRK